jgi:hypothetical protein
MAARKIKRTFKSSKRKKLRKQKEIRTKENLTKNAYTGIPGAKDKKVLK